MEVSRSGYYRWQVAGESAQARQTLIIKSKITQVHAVSRQTYGSPQVTAALRAKDLFADRLSSAGFAANQLRLWLSAFAYVLVERLRALALKGTELAQVTTGTIRLKHKTCRT